MNYGLVCINILISGRSQDNKQYFVPLAWDSRDSGEKAAHKVLHVLVSQMADSMGTSL